MQTFNRHNFYVGEDETKEQCTCCQTDQLSISLSEDHVQNWERFLNAWPESHAKNPGKLRNLLRRGIPHVSRPQLWKSLLGCEQIQKTSSFSYQECVRAFRMQLVELGVSEYTLVGNPQGFQLWSNHMNGPEKCEDESGRHVPPNIKHLVPLLTLRQIVVDVERSFPSHQMFHNDTAEGKEGRASLLRLLAVYALYNSDVGYCQGMSYIAGVLLMQMNSEEESFWAMATLFEKPKYLAGYFDNSLKRIQTHAKIFHKLVQQRMPRLSRHFAVHDVNPLMFVTPWFMCLYTSLPCWDMVLAIWDLLLLDGISTIFRVGLAILQQIQGSCLSSSDMAQILPQLLHPSPDIVNYEHLMPAVWKVTVEKWEIEALQGIVDEETAERPGCKRRHRSEVESDSKANQKRAKIEPVQEQSQSKTSVLFRRVVNMFAPLSQYVLKDTSNVPPRQPSPPRRIGQRSTQGQRFRKPGVARVRNQRSPNIRPSPRLKARQSQRIALLPLKKSSNDETDRGGCFFINPQSLKRKVQSGIKVNKLSPCEVASEEQLTPQTTPQPATPCLTTSYRPEIFQTPQLRQRAMSNGGMSGMKFGSPCHSRSLRKMRNKSAHAEHSFKTFHTPTPLRCSQVRRSEITSPDYSSPEVELQPILKGCNL